LASRLTIVAVIAPRDGSDADTTPTSHATSHRIEQAYRLLFGRGPTDQERQIGEAFIESAGNDAAAWSQYAQALLASNEMLFID
jgi:hypothetical protein